MSELRKKVEALPRQADDYTYQVFLASLDATWKGIELADKWDLERICWPFLMWAGRAHKVLPSFELAWKSVGKIPEDVAEQIWIARSVAEQRGRGVSVALSVIGDISQRCSVRPAVMKSSAYFKRAFGDYGLREVLDLDILTSLNDMEVLRTELVRLGFKEKKLRSQYSFKKDDSCIEAHLRPISKKRYWHIFNPEKMLETLVPLEEGDGLHRLSTTDEALLLICHAYTHSYKEALWLRDIASWWRVRSPDPESILEAFKSAGLQRLGWTTWKGMEHMGWKIPESWSLEDWGVSSGFDDYLNTYWHTVYRSCGTTVRKIMMFRKLELKIADGLKEKIRVVLPWVSVKCFSELYRALRGMESVPPGAWGQ